SSLPSAPKAITSPRGLPTATTKPSLPTAPVIAVFVSLRHTTSPFGPMRTTVPLPAAAKIAFSITAGCSTAPRAEPTLARQAPRGVNAGENSTGGAGSADLLDDPPSHDGIHDCNVEQ